MTLDFAAPCGASGGGAPRLWRGSLIVIAVIASNHGASTFALLLLLLLLLLLAHLAARACV